MQELIKIERHCIGTEEASTVNARNLWEKLEVQTPFHKWIARRIENTQLIEGQDFVIVLDKSVPNPQGGRPATEYILSLDAAKHIALMEGNQKGKEVRQYFIDVEKKARLEGSVPGEHPMITSAKRCLELTIKFVQVEEEQKRLAAVQQEQGYQICELQAKTTAYIGKTGYYSVLAYANLVGTKLTREQAVAIGKKATAASKELGMSIGSVPDERWGKVQTYHEEILRDIFRN